MEHTVIYKDLKATCESLLEDYPKYYEYVERRKFELANPVGEIDENVGGGKAENRYENPVLRLMITTESDRRLNNLYLNHYAIQVCYEETSEEVQTIIKELYFKEPKHRKYFSINDLCNAGVIHLSKTRAYIAFDDFIEQLMRQLGLDRFLN